MPFTPMARRTLQAAAEQREDLGHEATEPAHLLLALLEDSVKGFKTCFKSDLKSFKELQRESFENVLRMIW